MCTCAHDALFPRVSVKCATVAAAEGGEAIGSRRNFDMQNLRTRMVAGEIECFESSLDLCSMCARACICACV